MLIQLDKRFQNKLRGRIEKYSFEVGVLKDGPHKRPKKELGSFAGGPVRKKSPQSSNLTIAQVSKENRQRLGVNYLTAPFKSRGSSEILKFTKSFFDVVTGRSQPKRLENLLQAIVRNPILRGEYGANKPITRRIKGFNRLLIDTGQMFKGIVAKVKRGGR